MAKRHHRNAAPPRQTRTRTRQNKGALVSDPAVNTQLLNEQLRSLGLYAAPTLGDGNCLFRALSDQYYGTASQHLKLREEICDWMASYKERYEPFVLDERGFDVHLTCMRQPGTYGGHLELVAFANLKRRNIKVIQPGLVYIIEWSAGGDPPPMSPIAGSMHESDVGNSSISERDRRRLRREKKRDQKEKVPKVSQVSDDDDDEGEDPSAEGAVYVAYHDWEHFSSVRNLTGPHVGLPCVVEKRTPSSPASPKIKIQPPPRVSLRTSPRRASIAKSGTVGGLTPRPTQIPLPPSRSPSPAPSSSGASASGSSQPPSSAASSVGRSLAPHRDRRSGLPNLVLRIDRSPKRTFDESSAASGSNSEMSQGNAKRTRSSRRLAEMDVDVDGDVDGDTPSLSAESDSASSSSVSSPAPTPPPPAMVVVPPTPVEKRLTRRQRKALGLPKPRAALGPKASVGKIVIPGGRYKKGVKGAAVKVDDEEEDGVVAEWKSNGTGRLDVRGFRELKI
ncbi:cysteine proteinase [Rickenella mellea]|uniref:Cysteine proteinase n=1 Tax=Rickenella mellea TaxID=50990 RepID=A0A4Y7QGP2_9AGAM|nr:cysteine proteinase [Rickenella mellea]